MNIQNRRLNLLIVGCGSIGQRHLKLASERNDINLWACDVIESNLEESQKIAKINIAFTDYKKALLKNPDIVFICTPNSLHANMAIEAMRHGCHVFLEKPISDSLNSAKEILSVAQKTERILSVGYVLRFNSGLKRIKKIVEDGILGNIVSGRAMVGTYETLLFAKTPYRMEEEGVLFTDYTHEFDFLKWLLGDLSAITCQAKSVGDMDLKPRPNLALAILEYASGALVSLHLDYIQHPSRRIIELYGDKGTAIYDFVSGVLRIYSNDHLGYREEILIQARDDMFREQLDNVLQSVRYGTLPLVSGECGLAALAAAETALRSAKEGTRLILKHPCLAENK